MHSTPRMRWKLTVVLGVILSGCALDATDPTAHAPATAAVMGCPGNPNCPGNSDLLAAMQANEISWNPSDISPRRFSFVEMRYRDGTLMSGFHVVGPALRAWKPGLGAGWKTGPDLIGAVMRLYYHPTAQYLDLKLGILSLDYIPVQYYTPAAGLPPIFGYHVRYRILEPDEVDDLHFDPDLGFVDDICPYQDHYDNGVVGTTVVFWRGDRFDADTGYIYASVTPVSDNVGSWFNLSCAGEASIKMLRARTGGAVDPTTTVDQRKATLAMFTAKYCPGSPERYTHLGVDLDWSDKTGSNVLAKYHVSEAIWDENGAVCLDHPRSPKDGPIACTLDPCTAEQREHWQTYGDLKSGTPLLFVIKPTP